MTTQIYIQNAYYKEKYWNTLCLLYPIRHIHLTLRKTIISFLDHCKMLLEFAFHWKIIIRSEKQIQVFFEDFFVKSAEFYSKI